MPVRLRAPDGEIAEVPDELAEHYIALGAQNIGYEEEGLEANPFFNPLELGVGGKAILGAPRAAAEAVRGAGRILGGAAGRAGGTIQQALSRYLMRKLPMAAEGELVGDLVKGAAPRQAGPMGQSLREMWASQGRRFTGEAAPEGELGELAAGQLRQVARGGGGRQAAAERLRPSAPAEPIPQGRVVGEIKPRKPYRPKKGKKKLGSAESRTMGAKKQAKAREKGRKQVDEGNLRRLPTAGREREAPSQAMRGSSGPELERRRQALERVRASRQPEPEVDDLEERLLQSLAMEEQLTTQGVPLLERMALRQLMRGEL